MKRFITPLLVAMTLFMTACGQDQSNQQTQQPTPQTATLPTYEALTDTPYPPFELRGNQSAVEGFEIEIFNAIAKNQGFNVTYTTHAWDGIFDTLVNGEPSLVVSAVTITDEAVQNALLSDVYHVSPNRLVALDGYKLLSWKNQKIAVTNNEDLGDELVDDFGVNAKNIVSYNNAYEALSALIRGQVSIVAADATVLDYYIHSDSAKDYKDKFKIQNLPVYDSSRLVFAVDKSHPELLEKINTGLKNIKENGQLKAIFDKYGIDEFVEK